MAYRRDGEQARPSAPSESEHFVVGCRRRLRRLTVSVNSWVPSKSPTVATHDATGLRPELPDTQQSLTPVTFLALLCPRALLFILCCYIQLYGMLHGAMTRGVKLG